MKDPNDPYLRRMSSNKVNLWRLFQIIIFLFVTVILITAVVTILVQSFKLFDKKCDRKSFGFKQTSRIVNGDEAIPHSFPWIVSLQSFKSHFCAGSIINDEWIITTGYCIINFMKTKSFSVVVGLHSKREYNQSQVYLVDKIVTPFTNKTFTKDNIALVKVTRKFVFGETVQPIGLTNTKSSKFLSKCLAMAGWGSTNKQEIDQSEVLKETFLKVIDDKIKCSTLEKWESDTVFCAEPSNPKKISNACASDEGGPLVSYRNKKWYLEGVLSYVARKIGSKDICSIELPSFYSKIYNYRDYILKNIQ